MSESAAPLPYAPRKPESGEPPRVRESGIPLGRLLGIRVRLDWSWFVVFFLLTFSVRTILDARFPGWPEWLAWVAGVVSALGLFAGVLVHEFSHALMARRFGIRTHDITLFIFGGVARIVGEPQTPRAELLIAGIGPVTSLVIGLLCWAVLVLAAPILPEVGQAVIAYLAFVNVALAIFNMIPGFPLDGGRLLRAWFWHRSGDFVAATVRAAGWGKVIAVILAVYGVFLILVRGDFGGLWLAFIAWFLYSAAESSRQAAVIRGALEGLRVGQTMTKQVVTVPDTLPLSRLVDEYFFRHRYHGFPVEREGRVVGMVGMKGLQQVPRDLWPHVTVAQVMLPLESEQTVGPDAPLTTVLELMTRYDRGRLPVVQDGRLLGLITRRDLMHVLQLRGGLEE